MKTLIFTAFSLFAVALAVPPSLSKQRLLGEKECTYGPSYWCQNLTSAGDCHATKHCIQTVWIHKQFPEDRSSICDTCKEMVKEARDQLESNETQELIKEVFEGSCALLRLKPVVKECDKIADEYIPDLIDTLASQMNPSTVCSVAGLCNNPRFQQLLLESTDEPITSIKEITPKRDRCADCNTVMDLVVQKFNGLNRDEFLNYVLQLCGELSSFSDGCSNLVITHFEDIYSYLQNNLNSRDFCLLSGECFANFHKHDIEITPMSKIGYVPVNGQGDDLPCELCEQLVTHLREILVANTTESEFKQVLEGICKQAKSSFRQECLSIVDQYYEVIYGYIVAGLNPTAACQMINICPRGNQKPLYIAPILPVETAEVASKLNERHRVPIQKDDFVIRLIKPKQQPQPILSAQEMQLPIDLLVPPHQQLYNQQFCVFCEYFLHFVQKEITDPKVESEVEKVMDKACSKLPASVNDTCVAFVNTYEPALVAILAQEIDPSQVCPMIKACPAEKAKDVDIFSSAKSSSNCPLCLYAVTELESMIKGQKTKDEVKKYLDQVCDHLPHSVREPCEDFVNTYTEELVEMIVADLNPQEVCVYLKMCNDSAPATGIMAEDREEFFGGDTETNMIYDNTVNGQDIRDLGDEKCILCEFVMKEIDDELKNKKTDDEIKALVHGICKALPGTIRTSCDNFINQYADAIIILLQETMDPKSLCSYLKFCNKLQEHPLQFIKTEITKCAVCTQAAEIMQSILKNPRIDQSVEHIFDKTCRGMPEGSKNSNCLGQSVCNHFPKYMESDCYDFVRENTDSLLELIFGNNQANRENLQQSDTLKSIKETCGMCKFLMRIIGLQLKTKPLQEGIEKSVTQVCETINRPIKAKCESFVKEFGPKLISKLQQTFEPQFICSHIKACPKELDGPIDQGVTDEVDIEHEDFSLEIVDETNLSRKPYCAVCKAVVSAAKHLIKTDYSKGHIKNTLTKICGKLHKFGDKCNKFVNQYMDRLVDALADATKRNQVCRLITVCSHLIENEDNEVEYYEEIDSNEYAIVERNDYYLEANLETSDENVGIGECIICKGIVKAVKEIVKHSFTRDKVQHALRKACEKVHSKHCSSFVNKHFNQLVSLLVAGSSRGKVCRLLMVCSAQNAFEDSLGYASQSKLEGFTSSTAEENSYYLETSLEDKEILNRNVGINECFICKGIVNAVKEIVGQSFTRNNVQNALRTACQKIHYNHCSSFVNSHFNQMVNLLVVESSRERVCTIMMVCSIQNELEAQTNDKDHIKNEIPPLGSVEETGLSRKPYCAVCKAVVSAAKHLIKTDYSKGHIKNTLTKICGKLHKFGDKCNKFVNQYMDRLVDALADATKRNQVCRLITVGSHLIENEDNEVEYYDEINSNEYAIVERNDYYLETNLETSDENVGIGECIICKGIVKAVKEIVKHSFTRDKVQHALRKACEKVHSKHCTSFVNKHFNQMVSLLVAGSSRGKVCRLLLVCSAQNEFEDSLEYESQGKLEGFTSSTAEENSYYLETSLEHKEILNRNVGINECFICKGVVNAVREIVGQSFTRNNVQNALRTACQKIHYNHCSSFVNSHFNQMVNLLVVESSRGRVCTIMMVCSIQNELAQTNDEYHIENEIPPLGSVEETGLSRKPYCAVCKAVVSAAKHLIKTDYSKGHIKNTLSKICAKLHKFGDKCNKFVNQYMDRLVDALADATKRNKVCRLITVCSHLIEYEDNEMEYYDEIDNYVYEDNYLETNLEVSDENDCFICKEVVKAVKEIVKDSPTRDKVQKTLNKACHQVHSKHCSTFLKNHFNTLAKLLVPGASGEKICRFLRVCSVEPDFQDPGRALETGAIIPFRDICNMFISKSKKIIMETLKNETYRKLACESTDKPNVFCENDLEHLDQLSELTNAILTYHVGIAMPVCMTSDNSLENRLETKVTNFRPIICRGCQFVLDIVRQVLFNNTIMHLLVRDIKILCILLPDGLKRMCVKEISQFIQYIQNINTQDACHSLSLC
ncbi:uncharacterized protein LOC126748197 isoform X2 [Anthonomus grandis grandis]|uniref:uncharacterized protein LOC126748197 isoform X2 n=1 Tax=Anthonomus grandis grandis TaxID=2921223 RepID=UPI002165100D|nr:uncharacterized protein LOC126748197 isoform X2 [Anthonomus grandis grandis]